jgi:zinc protease
VQLISDSNLLGVFPFRHFRLGNGLDVLLVKNDISPVAAFLTHYKVGSAQEGDKERGLAHFFEHMMFRETTSLGDGDFDRIIAESGGVGLNAFTSYDTTAYHVNVPSGMLERVIELESDRMVNLVLSKELLDRERGAVLGEMQMYKDMPSEQLWNRVMAEAFPQHPYRHPVIGYAEQVEAFQVPDFERFYRAHYAPNRALVVVAGRFDERSLLRLLELAYGGLPAGAPQPRPVPPDSAMSGTKRVEIVHEKVTTESVVVASRAPGLDHADVPALQLLAALLSGGQSSPLHRRLVLEGLATHVNASLVDVEWMLISPGLFLIDVAMQHGQSAETGEAAVNEVLARFGKEGIPPDEFERALSQLRLAHYSGLRTNMSLARYLGGYTVARGDPLFGEKLHHAVERVTAEQVQDVLKRYVAEAPRVIVVQRPEGARA